MEDIYEDDPRSQIVSDLLRFADHNRNFNRKFVDEIFDFQDKHGYISEKQFQVLDKIYQQNNVKAFLNDLYGDSE